jgi:hypothetical protein
LSSAGDPSSDAGEEAGYDGPFEVPLDPVLTSTLTGCGGPGYATKFQVGSQTFDLTIDTGSATLAVASNVCAGCGGVTPLYTPGPTAMDTQQPSSDQYLQGGWNAEVYTDQVLLAGAKTPVQMRIAAINSQDAFFSDAGCGLGTVPFAPQGIVGFGPSDVVATNTDDFLTMFLQTATNVPPLFALEFCEQSGQLMLGGVDPAAAKLTGPAVYTPMTGLKYYTVTLDDMLLGGKSLGFGATDFGTVIVDSGTSVIALPSAVFQALASVVQSTPAFSNAFGYYSNWFATTNCYQSNLSREELDAQLPALTLSFPSLLGGTSVVTMKATRSYLPPTTSNGTTYYCSGIYPNPQATETIIGTSAMLGEMAIFDIGANRIGFAPQALCP